MKYNHSLLFFFHRHHSKPQSSCSAICKAGVPGVPGIPRINGRNGPKGDRGSVGAPSKKGPQGNRGPKGAKGEQGTQTAQRNGKQCAWKDLNDQTDYGLIKVRETDSFSFLVRCICTCTHLFRDQVSHRASTKHFPSSLSAAALRTSVQDFQPASFFFCTVRL